MAYKTRKKKVKKNVPEGMAHIHSTFNNTITTITDKDGNVISWASSGAIGFKGSKKSTPYAAGKSAEIAGAKAVADGKIDAMGVARQFLADSEWITKLIEDRLEDIRPCICCHNACFNMAHYKGVANAQSIYDASHIARCALDPQVMQSDKYKIERAKKTMLTGMGIAFAMSVFVFALVQIFPFHPIS